jgi:hypothetical protein
LQEFGVFLHPIVALRSTTPYEKAESMSPQRFVAKKMDNPTPLLSFCFGVATGNAVMDSSAIRQPISDPINQTLSEKAKATKTQSQFLAIAGAADMLLRSVSSNPCEFQLMVNRVMQMEQLSRSAKDFLSIMRITTSRALTQANLCRSVVAAMSSEVHVPYNCLYFLIVDNIGFKDIANHDPTKIGTLQCTQLIDVVIQQARMSDDELTADEDEENLQPLMSVAGSYVIADGQPTTQFERILAQDALTGANRYANVHCLMGGFHTILKLHHAIGKLFDYIFKYYFGTYRRTQARIQYIQFQEG